MLPNSSGGRMNKTRRLTMEEKVIKYNDTKAEKVDKRVLLFCGSDESIDRDGDIIRTSGWKLKQYKANPVVLFAHNHHELPVARTKRVWVDKVKKRLMFEIEFPTEEISTLGDSLYRLYKSGYMSATSVGFMPNYEKITYPEKKKGVYRIMEEQTLNEISLCAVPANANALITSKSMAKAVEQKIITQDAMEEFLKASEKEDKDTTIIELESKVAELELQLIDKELDNEPKDVYAEILSEFKYEADEESELIDITIDALTNED